VWIWLVLGIVGYLAVGIAVCNILDRDEAPGKLKPEDAMIIVIAIVLWPVVIPAGVFYGIVWLAMPSWRKHLRAERQMQRAKTAAEAKMVAAEAEQRRAKELAAAEETIGLPEALRLTPREAAVKDAQS
jgi:hypothetical protein